MLTKTRNAMTRGGSPIRECVPARRAAAVQRSVNVSWAEWLASIHIYSLHRKASIPRASTPAPRMAQALVSRTTGISRPSVFSSYSAKFG